MPDRVLCVVAGLHCAGKSLFLKFAAEHGFATLEWSHVIYSDLGHPEASEHADWYYRVSQRVQQQGPNYYPELIALELASSSGSHVVSGPRNPAELSHLLRRYTRSAVIWVDADPQIRFQRAQRRARIDAPKTLDAFIARDEEELRGGLDEIHRRYSTQHIENNRSDRLYYETVYGILTTVQKGS